ncbi:unnamed protein product [Aphanomyces euteiches]|uniref:Extradiol ring-cleavage dioxygenase class III enzyme subunit B domain-containing protein n=1 Tax=Aphanomyces euteiches TaxID=100861 RepID=A0A6G0XBJ9_9STRA|nr:hypothetical protein Ae201684_006652 [Aphanomyces euteiches]KAH9091151.1 hypothetical protein Ae201684P_006551 [Aphanomyces euteiches]KAH9148785.1 hypothetical protein AeRB84_007970 [Aphanomyces euteiches]
MVNTAVCRVAPAVFVNHGGGPMPYLVTVTDPEQGPTRAFLENVASQWLGLNDPATKPAAIVLVTAHWEENVVTISSSEKHELLYDYYGFPPEAYNLKYDAPGSPSLAQKIKSLLTDASIPSQLNPTRGWDHGVFIPMKLIYPAADIPIVQVSLANSLDPDLHFRLGQALAPLRQENIAIVGSGMSFHSFRPTSQVKVQTKDFTDALNAASAKTSVEERGEALKAWKSFPHARACHPREEHLIPLHVVAGAAGEGSVTTYDIENPFWNNFVRSFGWGISS